MKIGYDQLDFANVNSHKEFSLKTKILVSVIALFFILTPLYKISPEIFHTYEVFKVFYSCFGPVYL